MSGEMSFAAGQALAFLKVGVLAVAIFAVVWVVCKASVALYRHTEDPPMNASDKAAGDKDAGG